MTTSSEWRETRNARARARLERSLPAIFPAAVLRHAYARPLIPPTPRLAVESYWRAHVARADRLARALAARSGQPEGWTWRLAAEAGDGLPASFRMPPAPYREAAHARGKGICCLCGQPVYRFGWHADLWSGPNRNARWHAACVTAWTFWAAPSESAKVLRVRQNRRCAVSGKRLLRTAEVDHRIPLYAVWRTHRAVPWPALLDYWGMPNLQLVNRASHAEKCAIEAGERARDRRSIPGPALPDGDPESAEA